LLGPLLACEFAKATVTLPGELVLDPFAGSGSTFELDFTYFEQASRRMSHIRERAAQ
jgi:hypothetical protein